MYFYLITGILCSALIFVAFKLFAKYNINTFNAIVFNYLTAFSLGAIIGKGQVITDFVNSEWQGLSILLGFIFIGLFNVMAKSSQEAGVAITGVANKMSFVGPILFGVFILNESFSALQTIGVLLAIIAVFLTSFSKEKKEGEKKMLLPILLFFGGVALDTLLSYAQSGIAGDVNTLSFTGSIFGMAAIIGVVILTFIALKTKKMPAKKDVIAGILLGIPNFLSIYFFLHSLDFKELDNAQIFPAFNLSVILLNTAIGLVLFKEKLQSYNYIGILLAIASILLIVFIKP
ncbi:MAG: EamA family transporter [Bacteroidetes bacterium]|nr:EamA family transporter [Bacteroidota bacterium]